MQHAPTYWVSRARPGGPLLSNNPVAARSKSCKTVAVYDVCPAERAEGREDGASVCGNSSRGGLRNSETAARINRKKHARLTVCATQERPTEHITSITYSFECRSSHGARGA